MNPASTRRPPWSALPAAPPGGGRIVGVDYGESDLSNSRAFLRRYRWSFPNLSDPYARAGQAYGLTVLPSTFVIDPRGRIVQALRGPQTEQSLTQALRAAQGTA